MATVHFTLKYVNTGKEYDQSIHFQKVNIVKKHISIEEGIDENHRIVQEVMLAGYSKEKSIEAVERTRGRNAASAVKYLQDQEDNEDGLLPLCQQEPLRQDSSSSNCDWINRYKPFL